MPADHTLDLEMLIVSGFASLMAGAAWISSIRAKAEQTRYNRETVEQKAITASQEIYTAAMKTQTDLLTAANDRIAEQNRKIHELELDLFKLTHKIDILETNNHDHKEGPD